MSGRLIMRVAAVTLGITAARMLLNGGPDRIDLLVIGAALVCGAVGWYLERVDRGG